MTGENKPKRQPLYCTYYCVFVVRRKLSQKLFENPDIEYQRVTLLLQIEKSTLS